MCPLIRGIMTSDLFQSPGSTGNSYTQSALLSNGPWHNGKAEARTDLERYWGKILAGADKTASDQTATIPMVLLANSMRSDPLELRAPLTARRGDACVGDPCAVDREVAARSVTVCSRHSTHGTPPAGVEPRYCRKCERRSRHKSIRRLYPGLGSARSAYRHQRPG